MIPIREIFNKPKVIGLVADVNQGKSNLVYHLIEELNKAFNFKCYTYGLKYDLDCTEKINSLNELEQIRDSLVFIDEFQSLFDLEDRKKRAMIETTLRLINHNNNILVLIGLADNFKKFISSKLSVVLYKKVTFENFINGSSIKKNILSYCGDEKGSFLLNLGVDEVLIFNGSYKKYKIPYIEKYDSKAKNVDIFVEKMFGGKCDE